MTQGDSGSMIIRTGTGGRDASALAWVCAAVAASSLAIAAPPKIAAAARPVNAPPINEQQLAVVDRALEFCGPVDADSAKKLKNKVAELTKGASPDAVAQARDSDTYKQAYTSMGSFIGEIDPRNAKVACTNTAGGK